MSNHLPHRIPTRRRPRAAENAIFEDDSRSGDAWVGPDLSPSIAVERLLGRPLAVTYLHPLARGQQVLAATNGIKDVGTVCITQPSSAFDAEKNVVAPLSRKMDCHRSCLTFAPDVPVSEQVALRRGIAEQAANGSAITTERYHFGADEAQMAATG
jgi:hypothetical protein